jgi:predicted nucleic acid-binding protein
MTGVIICDAGPLIALGSIGELRLLQELFADVVVPELVATEIQAGHGSLPGASAFRAASWLRIASPAGSPDPLLSLMLDAGERSVIDLARQTPGATVLMDESRGREVARNVFGLPVVGTGRVLTQAKKLGLIPAVRPLVDRIMANGYWLSDRVIADILRLAGEI